MTSVGILIELITPLYRYRPTLIKLYIKYKTRYKVKVQSTRYKEQGAWIVHSFTYANTTSITNQSLTKAAVVLPKCLIHLWLNWLVFSAQLSCSTLPSHAGLYQLPLTIPMRLQAYLPLFQCSYPPTLLCSPFRHSPAALSRGCQRTAWKGMQYRRTAAPRWGAHLLPVTKGKKPHLSAHPQRWAGRWNYCIENAKCHVVIIPTLHTQTTVNAPYTPHVVNTA